MKVQHQFTKNGTTITRIGHVLREVRSRTPQHRMLASMAGGRLLLVDFNGVKPCRIWKSQLKEIV